MPAVAYLDTSFLIAIVFGEAEGASCLERLSRVERIYSSNLLEAELRAAFAREQVEAETEALLAPIRWVMPDTPLSDEIAQVAEGGYLKGADLWHLATALRLSPIASDIQFLTLDRRQRKAAERLGFALG